jgi:rhodanese-related sulfurtransferase
MGLRHALFPPSTSAQEAYDEARQGTLVLLDVRERSEWKSGHPPHAQNAPLSSLGSHAATLRTDRRYAAICHSGARSRAAVARLRSSGLDVVNVKGGIIAWRRAGLPLERR